MSGRSRPVLRLVSGPRTDEVADEPPDDDLADDLADPRIEDLVDGLASLPADSTPTLDRPDVAGLRGEIDVDVARLADQAGPSGSADLRARWDSVRRLCDPADLGHLVDHAESLYEAADSVRRQHAETADDLGPLWDTWQGPAAQAVQDRVSALARSAHALVVELETTAGRLCGVRDGVVEAVEYLADELAARPAGAPDDPRVWDRTTSACARAWNDAGRILTAGGGAPDVSRSGPPSP